MQLSKEASQPFLDVDRALWAATCHTKCNISSLSAELESLAMNSSQAKSPAEKTDLGAIGRVHDTMHSCACNCS